MGDIRKFGWLLILPAILAAQTPGQLSSILDRLERLEQENRALAEEVRTLRARLDGVPTSAVATDTQAAPKPSLEERVEIQEKRIDELQQTKVEAAQRFPVRLAGMAVFNAYMNSHQSDSQEYPVVALPTGPRSAGATMRQSIIGLEYRGPTAVWGGKVSGSIYMDFAPNLVNGTMRMRTGDIQIDWKNTSIMVGLEKPIFNPREPSSLAQLAVSPLTGAGNLWLWLPQARLEHDFFFSPTTGLRAQGGVVATREAPPYTGGPPGATLEPNRPGAEGRFEVFHRFDDERRIEIAPGFHVSETHFGGMSARSSLISTDWFVNPVRRVEFTGAFYHGQNVAPLGNGYGQGFGVYAGGIVDAVPSSGGWGQITLHTLPRLDFHLFTGIQADSTTDLAFGRISRNLLYGGNVYYRLAPNVILALETTQLRTTYIGQGVRINNHYDLALAYLF
jgi:hypothetical protein